MKFEAANKVKKIPQNFFSKLDEKISQITDKGSLIDLAKGNPDQATPKFIVDELKVAADKKENHGYTPFDGKQTLMNAIAAYYYNEYRVELDPKKEILTFNGSAIGISALPQTMLNPGDYVITTDPCYPEYYAAVALAGGNIWQLSINENNNYLPDLDSVPQTIINKAKILILNYPNNPTGAIANQHFFETAIEFGKKHGILVVNDFAYAAIGFESKPVSLLQSKTAKQYAVELNTLSKTYNMAGWRVGYVVGNESVISALKQYHAHVYSTVFGAVQDAAIAALKSSQKSAHAIRDVYQQRRDVLVDGLNNIGWSVKKPKGTFFVWAKVPAGYDSQSFTNLILEQINVVVAPGVGFGESGKNYIRMSLTHDKAVLEKVIARFAELKY